MRALFTLILLAACAGGSWPLTASAAPDDRKSVLILLPGQPGLPAASAIATGIRSVLVSAWGTRITIETEHVDVARFKGTGPEQHLRELYRTKYAGRPFDAIVVAVNEPLGFLLRSRDELWPGIPVIVCAIDERTLSGYTLPSGITTVTVRFDMEGTLRAALALLPETRHVALAGGASPQDQNVHELGRKAVRAFDDRLDLIDLTGLPIEDLMARLSALPERTIVLGSSFQMDGAGRRFFGVDLVGPVSTGSNRPLFSPFGTVLGLGVVGGAVVDFEAVGREAGELTLGILRGEPMPDSPRRTAATSMLRFDARQLRRWGLDEKRLPPGSEVLYRQPTLWAQYRWHVAGAAALVAVQAGLILALLVERQRRRRAQAGLAERLRFETLLSDLSATFASLPTSRVDEHIRDCLRRIAIFLGADRGSLWRQADDGQTLSATHSWATEEVDPLPPTLAVGEFPVLRALIGRPEGLSFATPAELPAEAAVDRRALERLGVRSLVAVPLRIGDRRLGLLTFSTLRRDRSWVDEVPHRLRPLAELLANALVRKQTEAALETSEALSNAMLGALPGEVAIIDRDGLIVQVNKAWAASAANGAGSMVAVSVGANYLDACRATAAADEYTRQALGLIESVLRGRRKEGSLEYPCSQPRGDRWFEMRVQHLDRPGGGAAIMHFDVSTRMWAEAEARRNLGELAHMNRVAALGELASSLAHELNQPLTAILSNAQAAQRLLATTPPDLDEFRECLADIIKDDRRAGEVIRRMRRLLKKDLLEAEPISLNEVVRNVVALVSNDAFLHKVAIELALAPELPAAHLDPVQIQQVVLNLFVNGIAAAATGPTAGRMVIVTTAAGEGCVEVRVHDSGKGIPESNLDRVFEPFFTTKREGLGMGLAICRSIVEAHGGQIWAENDTAGGATFRVRLPTELSSAE